LPTVHSAVLPAVTPESATDFFGLNPPAAGASFVKVSLICFGLLIGLMPE
jgi:hypothetical protein